MLPGLVHDLRPDEPGWPVAWVGSAGEGRRLHGVGRDHRATGRSLAGTFPGTYRAIRFHLRIFVLNDPNGATVFT